MLFLKNNLAFFNHETPSTPRSYEYKELLYSWRSPRLGGKTQDYLLETAPVRTRRNVKGAGMDNDLKKIFLALKELMKKYHPPLVARIDDASHYDLWSTKDVEIVGKKRDGLYFAGLIIQSKYVSFYYMPVYVDAGVKKVLKKELLAMLKGNACFHVKKWDKSIAGQGREVLDLGYKCYKKNGWV